MEAKDLLIEIESALQDYFEIGDGKVQRKGADSIEFELPDGEGFRLDVTKLYARRSHRAKDAETQSDGKLK